MENEKFQELVLEHMARLTQDITELKQNDIEVKRELQQVKESVIRIENDHGAKINALFDAREVQLDFNRKQEEFNLNQLDFNRKLEEFNLNQLDFNRRQEEFNLRIETKIDAIKEKVDALDQEFEIKLRRVK